MTERNDMFITLRRPPLNKPLGPSTLSICLKHCLMVIVCLSWLVISWVFTTSIGVVRNEAMSYTGPTNRASCYTMFGLLEERKVTFSPIDFLRTPFHSLVYRHLDSWERYLSAYEWRISSVEPYIRINIPRRPLSLYRPPKASTRLEAWPTCILCFTISNGVLTVFAHISAPQPPSIFTVVSPRDVSDLTKFLVVSYPKK